MANHKKIDEARKLFGLPEYATLEEIKKAYRILVSISSGSVHGP